MNFFSFSVNALNTEVGLFGDFSGSSNKPESIFSVESFLACVTQYEGRVSFSFEPGVRRFNNVYMLSTPHGYRVFDSEFVPIRESFLYRGGTGTSARIQFHKKRCGFVSSVTGREFMLPLETLQAMGEVPSAACMEEINELKYLGCPHREFGHAITECLAKLWPLVKRDGFLSGEWFHGFKGASPILESIYDFVDLPLDVRRRQIRASRKRVAYHVNEIDIPEDGMRLGGHYSKSIKEVWDAIVDGVQSTSRYTDCRANRIFLSRQKVGKRPCVDEKAVEELFSEYGFAIVHPEEYPFEQQVSMVAQADCIAGFMGSALHLCQFMRDGGQIFALGNVDHTMSDLVPTSLLKRGRLNIFVTTGEEMEGLSTRGTWGFFNERYGLCEFREDLKRCL